MNDVTRSGNDNDGVGERPRAKGTEPSPTADRGRPGTSRLGLLTRGKWARAPDRPRASPRSPLPRNGSRASTACAGRSSGRCSSSWVSCFRRALTYSGRNFGSSLRSCRTTRRIFGPRSFGSSSEPSRAPGQSDRGRRAGRGSDRRPCGAVSYSDSPAQPATATPVDCGGGLGAFAGDVARRRRRAQVR